MFSVRSSLTFAKKLALFSLLLVALCAPAWAESGKFGGVRYENPETGKIEYRDQATWTLTNGNLVISGG